MDQEKSNSQRMIRANVLGDVRAESDSVMLDDAFFESPDYRTLIESDDRCVVVGRRGTGKSALMYKLGQYFEKASNTRVVRVAPEEYEIIGLRHVAQRFGPNFRTIRAGMTIAWRYGLFMEICAVLQKSYRTKKQTEWAFLEQRLKSWSNPNSTLASRIGLILSRIGAEAHSPEEMVGDLPRALELRDIEHNIRAVIEGTEQKVVLLMDRLDEGYQPDEIGIGLVDGLVQAALEVKSKTGIIRPIVFLRDNVYRAIARQDPDYSRTIEGQTLRLYWDEYNLLNLTANRLRVAFKVAQEQKFKGLGQVRRSWVGRKRWI